MTAPQPPAGRPPHRPAYTWDRALDAVLTQLARDTEETPR